MNVEGTIVTVSTQKKSKTPVVTTQKVFYISTLSVRNDTMVVKTVTDGFSPSSRKGFQTPEQLKTEIVSLLDEKKNIFDDIYSLSYRKPGEKTNCAKVRECRRFEGSPFHFFWEDFLLQGFGSVYLPVGKRIGIVIYVHLLV